MNEPLLLALPGAAAAWTAEGCRRLLAAGTAESRGDLVAARALARSGGKVAAIGSAAWAAASAILALIELGPTAGWLLAPAGPALATGFLALLAGLSGKPRPTGYFAAAAWVVALALSALALAR